MRKKYSSPSAKNSSPAFVSILACAAVFSALALLFFAPFSQASSFAGPNYPNPLTVNSFTEFFSNLLAQIQGIVGWLAVIMIVIGGVVYITSGGRSGQITLAKTIITFAMIGFAIAVAAPSLLREIRDIASGGVGGGADLIATATPIADIVTNVMNFALAAIGLLAIIGFAISGIMYVTAAGDSSRAETAKRMAIYSIIAIAITGASLIILRQVILLLSA